MEYLQPVIQYVINLLLRLSVKTPLEGMSSSRLNIDRSSNGLEEEAGSQCGWGQSVGVLGILDEDNMLLFFSLRGQRFSLIIKVIFVGGSALRGGGGLSLAFTPITQVEG